MKELVSLIRKVSDFPTNGVTFLDLTPVFADSMTFKALIDDMTEKIEEKFNINQIDLLAGIDARGFILASAIAIKLNKGMLAIRKEGKLPPPVFKKKYLIEYGSRAIEIPAEGIEYEGKNILIIDDVLATAGTANASFELLNMAKSKILGFVFAIEIEKLAGRNKLANIPVVSSMKL